MDKDLWQVTGVVEGIKSTIDQELQRLEERDYTGFNDQYTLRDEVAYEAIKSLCDVVASLARDVENFKRAQ